MEASLHTHDFSFFKHDHVFDRGNPLAERRTWAVIALTATMMLVEITAGWLFNSMALLADGWHMSTHAAALGLTALSYLLARRLASDPRFAFGTWKIEVLGGLYERCCSRNGRALHGCRVSAEASSSA